MRIDAKPKFLDRPGHVELVYTIREGKQFTLGNILVKGNGRSQDKLVLREFRDFVPGRRFNSGELQDAEQRLRHLPYFSAVTITPIGEEEGLPRPAGRGAGAADGVVQHRGRRQQQRRHRREPHLRGAELRHREPPRDAGDIPPFSDRAFNGAGQTFRVSFEPGTRATNATLRFAEPYVFDQPYSLSNELLHADPRPRTLRRPPDRRHGHRRPPLRLRLERRPQPARRTGQDQQHRGPASSVRRRSWPRRARTR